VYFALNSLRRSEILALTWDNIDLENDRITVRGAVVQDENHKFVRKKANKTTRSARTIPIMIPELQVILASTPKAQRVGPVVDAAPHTIADRINAACEHAGLPKVGTHGLRHSFASLAYHLGMSELETMQIGGWSDTQTMHKIYTHLASVDRLKAENKMAQFFQNAHGNAYGK
jgi:integrase